MFKKGKERRIWLTKSGAIESFAEQVHELISIETVPENVDKYGSVPVSPKAAEDIGVTLLGCDVGDNGSRLGELTEIGAQIYSKHGLKTMFATLDLVSARMVSRLVKLAYDNKIITGKTTIGLTGRAAITGCKPHLILNEINKLRIYDDPREHVVFVDDGLARGAAVMARCMNSMGTPKNPIGGIRGGACVLSQRIEYHKIKREGGQV